jgi:hypothetical protein
MAWLVYRLKTGLRSCKTVTVGGKAKEPHFPQVFDSVNLQFLIEALLVLLM